MTAHLHCMLHTPLVGYVDPMPEVLAEVDGMIAEARERIARFDPELIVLFGPDHYNGFFYDVMPAFCIGMAADAIGDFGTAAGALDVPKALAEACAQSVLDAGIDAAVSYRMQVDHAFAQPLELLLGGLQGRPVIPVFINSVAVPLPGFNRARLLGEAIGPGRRLHKSRGPRKRSGNPDRPQHRRRALPRGSTPRNQPIRLHRCPLHGPRRLYCAPLG